MPVSYTHLDVYKRQVPASAAVPDARHSAVSWRVFCELAAGRISLYRKFAWVALADSGGAVCVLGDGGNGSLPGAQMEPVPCGGSDSAVLRVDDSGDGAVLVGVFVGANPMLAAETKPWNHARTKGAPAPR